MSDLSTQAETYWHIAEQLRVIADNIEPHGFSASAELLQRFARILDDASAPELSPMPSPNQKCPRCGFVTANVFDCPTCKNPMAPFGEQP